MGLWEMIVAVVALGLAAQLIQTYMKSKEMSNLDAEEFRKKYDPERIDRLEERVKVLEKIATDRRNNLKDEIDRL